MAATGRKWQPGPPKRYRRQPNRISPARSAWARTAWGLVTLFIYPEHDDMPSEEEGKKDPEVGDSIRVLLAQNSRRALWLDLTSLTQPELEAMKKLLDIAFELAEPIVIERDKVARDAELAGDDSFARNYRAVPQFVVRAGKIESYDQGLHHGSQDSAGGSADDGDSDEGPEGDSQLLAQSEQEDLPAQDDLQAPHLPEGIRNLGG